MKRNHMKKFVNYLSSGKNGRVRRWALCSLGAAAVFGLASSLILSEVTVDSGMGKATAQELAEIDGSYEVEADGFVTTISVENINGSELADMGEKLLFASVEDPVVPSSSLPEGTDMETDGESAGNNKVEYQVEEVTEGEDYDALVAQFAENTGGSTPTQVMKVTASQGGKELDLSGCDITLQVTPTDELVKEAVGVTGMSVTVLPLGGETTVQSFSDENMNSGEQLPTVDVSYTVPEGSPAMYAVGYSTDVFQILNQKLVTGDINWDDEEWPCLKVDRDIIINLNGHKIIRESTSPTHTHDDSCYKGEGDEKELVCGLENALFSIVSEGSLTIKDESGTTTGGITAASGIENLICVRNKGELNIEIEGGCITGNPSGPLIYINDVGKLNIFSGTLRRNGGNSVVWAFGNGTVNMYDGTITGGANWVGGGIYAEHGTVNIFGGSITNNGANWIHGGGICMEDGTINISGGEIKENSAGYGGGICMRGNGTVNISGEGENRGKINDNSATEYGGGIFMGKVVDSKVIAGDGTIKISGGEICNNRTTVEWGKGGGIYAASGMAEMSGGTISTNSAIADGGGIYVADGTFEMSGGVIGKENIPEADDGTNIVEGNTAGQSGGGVWAKKMVMSGGTIAGNRATRAGGGVYTHSMEMTDGTISKNHVVGETTDLGGGGIFIARKIEEIGTFRDDTEGDVHYNMSISGGTISDNTSRHTGGGIFVNTGAVAYITGAGGRHVNIIGNIAHNTSAGHGYAGGGIFVEHPNNTDAGTAKQGGQVYIYNAVITGNHAQYGGGVAGCGSSNVTVCSVNGVAVYGNEASGSGDIRYSVSGDLYVDGKGVVDGIMMGGVKVTWQGKRKLVPGEKVDEDEIADITVVGDWQRDFDYGFYLYATGLNDADKATINSYATVFIQGNTSGSGGGGVGGNGFMKLGLRPSESENYELKLKKIVSGAENNGEPETFSFSIRLTDDDNEPITSSIRYYKGSEASDTQDSDRESPANDKGLHQFRLGNNEYIRLVGLPLGTRYTITETVTDGYESSFEKIKGDVTNDNTANNVVIGWIAQDNTIVFTNTALYALPETGGQTAAIYYLLGCALLITASAGGWMYRKRSKSV